MSTSLSSSLHLKYEGLSSYLPNQADRPQQSVCLMTDQNRDLASVSLEIKHPLEFREGLRTLLMLNGLRTQYQPETPELYETYSEWRRGLNPFITPLESTQALYAFLAEHDPTAWLGCDPTVHLNDQGLSFEILDSTGRVYGAISLPNSAISLKEKERKALKKEPIQAHFESMSGLRQNLSMIHEGASLDLVINAQADQLGTEDQGVIDKHLPAPANWQRNFTQLLSATTLELRRVPLSRMDVYNLLNQLRLNADIPKEKKGIRFELVPGKAPVVTIEPWNVRLVGHGGVYQGDQAEVIGIWDRRDLLIFDLLLPYIKGVEVLILGEAQPTFWVLDCGSFTFTLGTMGFRPNNWSRGVLLDLDLPRTQVDEASTTALERALKDLKKVGHLTRQEWDQSGHTLATLRLGIQNGLILPNMAHQTYMLRTLFDGFNPQACLHRNDREERAHALVSAQRVALTVSELPTGEIEVTGVVSEPKTANMPTEPEYAPRFQIKEGAGMRKVGCDCAWMKDREKQKIGPCPHVQALWMQYGLDEAQRRADLKAQPDRI
jgi:hypothetical protein